MNSLQPPLLHRPPLQPGESLPFFLGRLAHENGYHSPTLVIQLCRERLSRRDMVTRPTHPETYQVLSALTRVAADQLYAACVHRFAPTLTPPTQPAQTLTLPSGQMVFFLPNALVRAQMWAETKAQFCPLCLQLAAYHRIDWLPVAAAMCFQHQCLLQRGCPACTADIPIQALREARCPQCQFDLTRSPLTRIKKDELGLFSQTVLRAWLGLGSLPETKPPFSLPNHSPTVLYRLIDTLRWAMMRLDPYWDYLYHPQNTVDWWLGPCFAKQDLTSARSYLLYASAFKALLNWPHNFFDFLDAYKRQLGNSNHGSIQQDFDYLYRACLQRVWRHPAFDFVQDAFNHYLVDNYLSEMLARLERVQPSVFNGIERCPNENR